jgi:cell division protease FtsH
MIAYHEIGHALVATLVAEKEGDSAPVHKITIVPRSSGALGYSMQVDKKERFLMTREQLLSRISTFAGGRAAEEQVFGTMTSGASNDIEQMTKLARAMVARFGMTEEFGMVAMETVTNRYLGGDPSLTSSPETGSKIDAKVVEIVKDAHDKAVCVLRDNREKLNELAEYLLERETITGEEFMGILKGNAGEKKDAGKTEPR